MQTDNNSSTTWLLFEDGTGAKVHTVISPNQTDEHSQIDAHVLIERRGGFMTAARRAAETVYGLGRDNFPIKPPIFVSYELEGIDSGQQLSGESGGLAFAIDLARKVFKKDPGAIAATGVIKSGHEGGPIGPVKGITGKLEAAISVLPENGWVFCPKANDEEISDDLRKLLNSRGLKLRPVSSVSEALKILFPLRKPDKEHKRRSRPFWVGTVLFILCAATAASIWFKGEREEVNDKNPSLITHKIPDKDQANSQPGPSLEQAALSQSVVIDLSGETPLMKNLAKQLSKRLFNFFTRKKGSESTQTHISGRVSMVQISENLEEKSGNLHSKMTVTLKDLSFKKGNDSRSLPTLEVSVDGIGPAGSLVSQAAEKLLNKISGAVETKDQKSKPLPSKQLQPKVHRKSAKGNNKGFD